MMWRSRKRKIGAQESRELVKKWVRYKENENAKLRKLKEV